MRPSLAWLALLLALLACAPAAHAQEDEGEEGDESQQGMGIVPFDARTSRRGAATEKNRLHIREARELEVRCKEAEAAEGRGDFARAARGYLDVLKEQRDPEAGVQGVCRVGERRWTSFARYARDRLLAFPEEGRRAFRAIADAEARALFDAAVHADDLTALESLWRTYPLASSADEALERLGDAAWEGGEPGAALDRWTLAATIAGGDLDGKRLASKLAVAKARLAASPAPLAAARSPVTGGDNAHAAPLPALLGIDPAPRFTVPLPASDAGRSWGQKTRRIQRFDGPPMSRDEVLPEHIAAVDRGRIVVANGNAVSCYDLATGERRWYQGVWNDQDRGTNLFYGATIAGGRAFVPFTKRVSKAEFFRGIPIVERIAYRRLVAFDLATGKRIWDHEHGPDEFLKGARVSVGLPPVAKGGVLYAQAVLCEGQAKSYAIAVDAATGRLLWRRFLQGGQVELTMFGEPAIEPLHMQVAEKDGTVFVATGFGVMAALEARTGEIQWLATYDSVPIEAARTYYAQERILPWRNQPPVVADGVVVAAPIDAERAFAFDAATGEMRWSVEAAGLRRLLGAWDGRAVFQGDRVQAHDIRTGKLVVTYPQSRAQPALGEEETGRGLICDGTLFIPQATRLVRINLQTGERGSDLALPGGVRNSGSLVYVGRDLVAVNPLQASIFRAFGPSGADISPAAPEAAPPTPGRIPATEGAR